MENRQREIRHLRSFLCGWAKHLSSAYKLEQSWLSNFIHILDKKAETTILTKEEHASLRKSNKEVAKFTWGEETKWLQWAKVKHIQQGGNNTKYFHLVTESANFVSLRFCVLDNNIMDIECVISCADSTDEEMPGRIIRPGVAG
jgi:hypothetical protein